MGIDKVKRLLVIFGMIFVISSYLLLFELWSQESGKLLHALTMFALTNRLLKIWWSGWYSMCLGYYKAA